MSVATYNPNAYYIVGNVVAEGSVNYNCIQANSPLNPQLPSASPLYWTAVPIGDITDIVAGTGLSGGGASGIITLSNAGVLSVAVGAGLALGGTTQDPTIKNSGVLSVSVGAGLALGGTSQDPVIGNTGVVSLDGQTGVLTTDCGQYYKSSNQTLSTVGSPAFTTIVFDTSSYTGTSIKPNPGSTTTQWVVGQKGIYSLGLQVQLSGINTGDFSDPSIRLAITCLRGAQNNAIIASQFEITNATPTNPAFGINGTYVLNVGDIIGVNIGYYLNALQSILVNGVSAAPNDYDLNTFWDWNLIKPLP